MRCYVCERKAEREPPTDDFRVIDRNTCVRYPVHQVSGRGTE
jgi:hypothetical protein